MSKLSLVYVHTGKEFPSYLNDNLYQTRLFHSPKTTDIYVITNDCHKNKVQWQKYNVTVVSSESLQYSNNHRLFLTNSQLDKTFRDGFWTSSTERFFFVETLMHQLKLENVIHLENDVLLFTDFSEKLNLFRKLYKGIATTFDCSWRCVPGLMYIRNAETMSKMMMFFAKFAHTIRDGMAIFANYRHSAGITEDDITNLPLIPDCYPKEDFQLEVPVPSEYSRHFDEFQSVFDAAAIGQYWGGVDPRNTTPQNTMSKETDRFINESSVFNCDKLEFTVHEDSQGRRVPFLNVINAADEFKSRLWKINNLHIHCKDLKTFVSIDNPDDVKPVAAVTPVPTNTDIYTVLKVSANANTNTNMEKNTETIKPVAQELQQSNIEKYLPNFVIVDENVAISSDNKSISHTDGLRSVLQLYVKTLSRETVMNICSEVCNVQPLIVEKKPAVKLNILNSLPETTPVVKQQSVILNTDADFKASDLSRLTQQTTQQVTQQATQIIPVTIRPFSVYNTDNRPSVTTVPVQQSQQPVQQLVQQQIVSSQEEQQRYVEQHPALSYVVPRHTLVVPSVSANILDTLDLSKGFFGIHIPKTAGLYVDKLMEMAKKYNSIREYVNGGFTTALEFKDQPSRWAKHFTKESEKASWKKHKGLPNMVNGLSVGGKHTKWNKDTHHVISVVRNPYDLLVSLYFHENGTEHGFGNVRTRFDTFEKFVRSFCAVDDTNFHYDGQSPCPQMREFLFTQLFCADGHCVADVVVRYEKLGEGLKTLFHKMSNSDVVVDLVDEVINKTVMKTKSYKEYYTDELKELVHTKCFRELTAFGYDFNGPTTGSAFVDVRGIQYFPQSQEFKTTF
jgi:hypothetical protein